MTKIRILIADDHAAVRAGLAALIFTDPEMELVGQAADGAQALAQIESLRPDVVVLDLLMPGQDGLETLAQITRRYPTVRVLVLTDYEAIDKITAALDNGARGYLSKGVEPRILLQAIRGVHQGELGGRVRSSHDSDW